jgi:outer membrane protein W
MKLSSLKRMPWLAIASLCACGPAAAQAVVTDAARLHGWREGWFVRGGVAHVRPNTVSGEVTDVTGPVIRQQDVSQSLGPLLGPILAPFIVPNDIGIPANLRADVGNSTSVFGSVGKFITDNIAVEGLVLAVPFEHKVTGLGVAQKLGEVASIKQLPPTILGSYYFGSRSDALRPFFSAGINYTRFLSAKATPALEAYAGGPTEIKLSSSTGPAAFAGVQYQWNKRWHTSLQIGQVKVRTTATLTTRNTQITSSSPIIADLPAPIPSLAGNAFTAPILDSVLNDIAQSRGGDLGTFERKLALKLDPHVVLLSIGYSF